MMLTDDELNAMRRAAKDDPRVVDTFWHLLYARAIIAAYQAKLRQGVELPEPDAHFHLHRYGETLLREQVSPEYKDEEGVFPLFTKDQAKQYGDARDQAGYLRGLDDAKQAAVFACEVGDVIPIVAALGKLKGGE